MTSKETPKITEKREFDFKNHAMNELQKNAPYNNLGLSPSGHLRFYFAEASEAISNTIVEKIDSFFSVNQSVGLLRLGLTHFNERLPDTFLYWQQFSHIFIAELCKHADTSEHTQIPTITFPADEINQLIFQAPFFRGVEYFNFEVAKTLWDGLQEALFSELAPFHGHLNNYLSAWHSTWNTVGKVCFHLAENKKNADFPFAFLATYTTGLSKSANAQHVVLGNALETYAGKNNKSVLLSLLLPVHRAAEKSAFLKVMVDTGKIFRPQAWTAVDAHQFLKDIPLFEESGVMIRVPNWWNKAKPPRPEIKVTVGEKTASMVGLNSLLDFDVHYALPSGEILSEKEFYQLLNTTENLVQIKGQWVQVDSEKLNEVLSHWKSIERQVQKNGLSFAEGLRLLSGVSNISADDAAPESIATWSTVVEGDFIKSALSELRNPGNSIDKNHDTIFKKYLNAQLRPYQLRGVQWLWWLYNLKLGGCLADDMGLGKTIQVISLLLLIKHNNLKAKPHLLILPASLVGNWQAEIIKFAPSLSVFIAHGSIKEDKPELSTIDLIITTYGMLNRLDWLSETAWDIVIGDEAQAIKNPSAKQTRAVKALNANVRFVLTGTPIENRLLDLWSLFDFVSPGLLGSHKIFADYGKKTAKENNDHKLFYAAIRKLVNPYILRRLKSDKSIISDLPDKTEMQTYCTLSKQQIGLYQQAVNELSLKLEQEVDGINRRGLVMSYLLRFKQICNHPNQWMGHGDYAHELSGKFLRLKELCEIIAAKQEKVLVFTQFREIIPALCTFLSEIFNQEGLHLHGQTPIKERAKRVEQFQKEEGPPFFVLSLKAGGTGLNLTAASHVIHFDRWWNPAVENQATDRAFRIGQKRNVLVHKFICRGTIEEKIDGLLAVKKVLSSEIIGQDNEVSLTEMSDSQLLNMVTLDIHRAIAEH